MNKTIVLLVALAALGLALADGAAALPPTIAPELPGADCEPDPEGFLASEDALLQRTDDVCAE